MSEVRQFTVAPDDDGIRLDRWFKRHLPEASFNLVSRWARTGQLRVDGKRAAPGDRIEAGQTIRVPPAEPAAAAPAPSEAGAAATLSEDEIAFVNEIVIHRDPQAIVVNKPPGLATQGGTKTKDPSRRPARRPRRRRRGNRPKLVHRLDKDTSGVLLVARTAARRRLLLQGLFRPHRAQGLLGDRHRRARRSPTAMIDLPLAKQPGTGGEKMHVDEGEGGLPARTRYRMIERAGNRAAWVELQPLTGRTHQLRVHMAAIGHPILGDGKYGGPDAFLTGAISRKLHLHARRLRIDHPDGGRIDVTAELPDAFRRDPRQSRLRPGARRPAARRGEILARRPKASAGPPPPPPSRAARSARASGAAGGSG